MFPAKDKRWLKKYKRSMQLKPPVSSTGRGLLLHKRRRQSPISLLSQCLKIEILESGKQSSCTNVPIKPSKNTNKKMQKQQEEPHAQSHKLRLMIWTILNIVITHMMPARMTTPPFPTGTVTSGNQQIILTGGVAIFVIMLHGWVGRGGAGWGNNVHVYFANIG